MIRWSLINRGEINSLKLWVQSGTRGRIHRWRRLALRRFEPNPSVLYITE
jgi:hypothetical protein